MAYNVDTSIHGRRLGLQKLSSNASGSNHGTREFLVGPDAYRENVTTSNSTATNVRAWGVQYLPSSSVGSSQVYSLDPPIPGITVTVVNSTKGTIYLRASTDASITVWSTQESSACVIKASSHGGIYQLVGISTARWGGIGLTSGTSSNSGTFITSTST